MDDIKKIEEEFKNANLAGLLTLGFEAIANYSEKSTTDYSARLSVIDVESQKYLEQMSPIFKKWQESINAPKHLVSAFIEAQLAPLIFNTLFNSVCERNKPTAALDSYSSDIAQLFSHVSSYMTEYLGSPLMLDLSNRLALMRPNICALILLGSSISLDYEVLRKSIEDNNDNHYGMSMGMDEVFKAIEKNNTGQGIVLAPEFFSVVFQNYKTNFLPCIRNYEDTPPSQIMRLKIRQLNMDLPRHNISRPQDSYVKEYLDKIKIMEEKKELQRQVAYPQSKPGDKKVAKL